MTSTVRSSDLLDREGEIEGDEGSREREIDRWREAREREILER